MKTRIVQPAASFQPPETCTEHQECRAAQTPLEDLRKNALEHYERVTTIAHEWHSMVPKSINAYFDSLIVDTTGDGAADARAIRLPFPCGCLDAHTGGGITVEEYTCETHRAITTYATAHSEERWREAIEAAARQECVFCAGVEGYNPSPVKAALPVETDAGNYVHRNDPPHGLAGVYCKAPRIRALFDKEKKDAA